MQAPCQSLCVECIAAMRSLRLHPAPARRIVRPSAAQRYPPSAIPTGANHMTDQSTAALLARIAQLEAAAKATERKLSLKVSEKGAVSLYGMGRFPVTLYGTQW